MESDQYIFTINICPFSVGSVPLQRQSQVVQGELTESAMANSALNCMMQHKVDHSIVVCGRDKVKFNAKGKN